MLLVCMCCLSNATVYAQLNLKFAKALGNSGSDQGNTIAVDDSGNIYLIGKFERTVDFDPGPGTKDVTGPGTFCAKYDSTGSYIWAFGLQTYGTTIDRLVLDASSNIYITGTYTNTVDFDPSPNTVNLTTPLGKYYQFMAKYTKDGAYVWAKRMEGEKIKIGSIAVDDTQNVYLTGSFTDSIDLDPGPDTALFLGDTQDDIYFAKYDINGSLIWAKTFESINVDQVTSIALDKKNNILLTGLTYGDIDLDPGPGVFKTTFKGNTDVFFAKYDNSGNFLWGHELAEFYAEQSGEIKADKNGNVYVSGAFMGSIDFDFGPGVAKLVANGKDGFVAKYDEEGKYVWAQKIGEGDPDFCFSIALDDASNVYVTGSYRLDILLAKYKANGDSLWRYEIGGGTFDEGYSIAVNKEGNVYITGPFVSTVDFDPTDGIFQLSSYLAGGQDRSRDCFFAKYCQSLEQPGYITGNAAVCEGTKGVTYTVQPVSYATSYSWSLPNGATVISGAATNSITVNFDLAVTGNIRVRAINNCGSTIFSPAFKVTVYAKPAVTLDFPVTVCMEQPPFQLTTGKPAGGTYSGKGVNANYFYPSMAGIGSHNITYTYTDSLGCINSAAADIHVSVCTGITGLTPAEMTVHSFPNPFHNSITFQLQNIDYIATGELVLYNSTGAEVIRLPFCDPVFTINRGNLSNGIYFYRLFINDHQLISNGKLAVE